jgi:hypothetical protein
MFLMNRDAGSATTARAGAEHTIAMSDHFGGDE